MCVDVDQWMMIDTPPQRPPNKNLNSWNSDRAKKYMQINQISGLRGTAVTIQSMVFGTSASHAEEHLMIMEKGGSKSSPCELAPKVKFASMVTE